MFLILNTAVGGNWPGDPDGSTQWPQWHLIDFVRMYQRYAGTALLNGGFEQVEDGGFLNWNTFGETTNIVSGALPANAHSGARAVKMSGRFTSPTNTTFLFQSLPASAGQIWQAAVWAANRPGDVLQGRNHARLKLEFIDGFGAILAAYPVTLVNSNTPAAYAQFSLRQKAPVWTTHARITLEFNQYDNAAGSVNLDDAELFLVTPDADGPVRSLVNESFEQGDGDDFTSWLRYGALSNIVTEATAPNVYDGSRAVRLISVANGSVLKTGLYQDIPSRAGEYWTASVWARQRASDPLQGGNSGVLKLEFLDGLGNVLQVNEVTVVTASSPVGYTNAVIQQFAPAGTALARITLECRQVAGGGGSVDFDLAGLTTTTDTSKLINRGLELWDGTNFPGWSSYGAVTNVIRETNSFTARTGTNALRLFGQFPANSAANESGLYQDMTASPGQIWQASVWAQNRANDGVQGSNQARLKLEFLDAGGIVLERDQIIAVRSNSPAGYQPFVLRRVAPNFTTKARIVLAYFQQNNAGGGVNFDDAELHRVLPNEPRPVLNSGFEDTVGNAFPNWPAWNNVIPNILPDTSSFANSGSAAVKMFGTFNAVSNTSGLYQDFPALPNELWQGSIWARSRPGDQLQGNNSVRLKLEFFNTNNTLLSTNLLTILNATSPTQYQQFTLRRLSPAGTARARLVAEFLQPNYAGGAANLDDAQMGVLTAAATNRVLLNGGFEVGQGTEFGEWMPYGPGSLANVVRDTVTANARNGTQCLKLYGAFNGADNNSGLYQDLPVAPGEIWQASIWARNRPGDLLQGNNQALLKLEYLDSLGNGLAGSQVIAAKAGSPTSYQWFALRSEAPANAAFARLVIEFKQSGAAAGAVNLDDAQLQLVTAQP